ncbi:MAG: hypothetical protein KF729_19165 [Sandaracinaceae bacterium]|nr:hypothetical protein [Sandaracinaceae bacterium]
MTIDTERVRRHIRAALTSLPLLACAAEPASSAEITQRIAPPVGAQLAPLPVEPADSARSARAPRTRAIEAPHAGTDEARAVEIRHAERRKHPPRAVSGRPLRVDGRDVIAHLRRVDATPSGAVLGLELEPALRERAAAEWLRDARMEHASVASFERAHAELQAHDAPEAILAAVRRAARDEVVHTSLCLAMAWRYGGPALAPGPLAPVAPRGGALAALAADVFEEGCVGETFAATVAGTGARRCAPAEPRAILTRIAEEESAHAALAWATLRWALARDPSAADAVAARAAALAPTAPPRTVPPPGPLAAHGRLDPGELGRAYATCWSELVAPLLAETLGRA